MATPVTEQAIVEMLAQARPVPQVAPAVVPTPQSFFNLPPPIPTTRFFGGAFGGRRSSRLDPFEQQERYRRALIEQQAEQQAAELGKQLAGLDPTAQDAPQQRLRLVTQLPLSQSSTTGRSLLNAWDETAKMVRGEKRDYAGEKEQELIGQLAEAGATPEEIEAVHDSSGRVNSILARRTLGELKRLNERKTETIDDEIKRLENTIQFKSEKLLGSTNQALTNTAAEEARLQQLYQQRLGVQAPQATPVAPQPINASLIRVNTPEEARALPPGTQFVTPDGKIYQR